MCEHLKLLACCFLATGLLLWPLCGTGQPTPLPPGALQVPGGEGEWIAAPNLGPGAMMLLMEGDPRTEGTFTMRLKGPAGFRVPPHLHPRDERVTILSGEVRVGFGDVFDEERLTALGPGSFYLNPAGSHHFVWFVEETVMQLTGMGPWELHYLHEQ